MVLVLVFESTLAEAAAVVLESVDFLHAEEVVLGEFGLIGGVVLLQRAVLLGLFVDDEL